MYIDISHYHGNMHQNDGFKSQGITLNAWRAILNHVDAHGVQSACTLYIRKFTFSDTVSADHSTLGILILRRTWRAECMYTHNEQESVCEGSEMAARRNRTFTTWD